MKYIKTLQPDLHILYSSLGWAIFFLRACAGNAMRLFGFCAKSLVIVFGMIFSVPASAQETGFSLELNNARDVGGGCRLTYVAMNRTATALEKTSYEVVIFDAEGTVSQFLVLEFGRLPIGKTKVVQFDLAETGCGDISRLLINDAKECLSQAGASSICLDELVAKSRAKIEFSL